MRILFLTHSFNSLSQRLFVELEQRGHEVSVEFDINDAVAEEAVEQFQPELILAPFLKRAIPESIWRRHRCLVIHPGIKGDRGPSALDWAILRDEPAWGVTCLQAEAEMDAGAVWASVEFPLRAARKSSLYRNEVTEAAVSALLTSLQRIEAGAQPEPLDYNRPDVRGSWNPAMVQGDRAIDWQVDGSEAVLRKIRSADSMPGVRDRIGEREYYLFNAWAESELRGEPGALLAKRDGAICRATRDGAVWITHLRLADPGPGEFAFKLPATRVLPEAACLPERPLGIAEVPTGATWQEIHYREAKGVGYLSFEFYNGAMDSEQCRRLQRAVEYARRRPVRVLVLLGSRDFWSNGIHLNQIEAAASAADESWRNINAMNDLCLTLLNTPDQLLVAGMQGNAGAGGVFMALAADRVFAREGVVLNPHYRSMGNLYGSEYWTYLLPRRVGDVRSISLMERRLPISARQGVESGLLDACFGNSPEAFVEELSRRAERWAADKELSAWLSEKRERRAQDEARKPLAVYREEELERMRLNFYGFDPSYHVARYHFVEKLPKARTPVYLARHRRLRRPDGDGNA